MPALARWRPFQELEELRQRLDRVLEETRGGGDGWTLAIDLQQHDDKYVLRADMPGMKPEDVQVEVEDDVLTVAGKHEETDEEKKGGYVRRERRYGSFSRSMTLPKGVSADQIEASCKDGVLEVTIPRPKGGRAPEGDNHAQVELSARGVGGAVAPPRLLARRGLFEHRLQPFSRDPRSGRVDPKTAARRYGGCDGTST